MKPADFFSTLLSTRCAQLKSTEVTGLSKELPGWFPSVRMPLWCLWFVVVTSSFVSANAQSDPIRIYGAEDQSIPTPATIAPPGQMDANALGELAAYLNAINITSWTGLQAPVTLTDSTGIANPATLSVLHTDCFRLDVQTSGGTKSTRIQGNQGKSVEVDGRIFYMLPPTAMGSIFAAFRLLSSYPPDPTTSFIDEGQVQVDGKVLHRIAFGTEADPSSSATDPTNFNVTDLYFDPNTHLLVKSASSLQLSPDDSERYLIVVSYSDYRMVNGSLIPFSYSESMNGQHQWSLQLTDPNLQPVFDSSYFSL